MQPAEPSPAHATVAHAQRGSCLCGSVRYEARIDWPAHRALRSSVWEARVLARDFRLLAGEGELSGHQFSSSATDHFFCERCGLQLFSRCEAVPGAPFYTIDLRSLDAPARPRPARPGGST